MSDCQTESGKKISRPTVGLVKKVGEIYKEKRIEYFPVFVKGTTYWQIREVRHGFIAGGSKQ